MAIKKIPCGGFYVDDNAIETRDGKPYLKTGGSDPVLANAKATGGIGWTEEGGKTEIIGQITVTSSEYMSEVSVPMTGMNLQEVYNNVDNSNIRVVYNGVLYDSCYVDYDDDSGYYTLYCNDIEMGRVAYQDENYLDMVRIVTGNPNTTLTVEAYVVVSGIVHTIDPKYLGGGGGADVVIKATYDNFGRNPVATLVAGSFNDLATKLSNFVPVTVHLVCETKDEDMGESYCLNVPCRVVAQGDYSDITNISFISIEPWMENIDVCVPITTITFNSDNTVQAFTN